MEVCSMSDFDNVEITFKSLLKSENLSYKKRWHPIDICVFNTLLVNGLLKNMEATLRKNISYNLQYLEYIQFQLKELKLPNVVVTMLFKSFIITGVSIIEAIFYHLLKSNGLWNQKEWEIEKIVASNPIQFLTETRKFETYIYKKIPKADDEMNLDSIIKKIEHKELIDIPHEAFPYIRKLKRLRNKVHLQINEHPKDTDWFAFNYIDYLWMMYILHIIMTNSKFGISQEDLHLYYFIQCSPEEIQKLRDDVQSKKANKIQNTNISFGG
jgi:hypothetical protein